MNWQLYLDQRKRLLPTFCCFAVCPPSLPPACVFKWPDWGWEQPAAAVCGMFLWSSVVLSSLSLAASCSHLSPQWTLSFSRNCCATAPPLQHGAFHVWCCSAGGCWITFISFRCCWDLIVMSVLFCSSEINTDVADNSNSFFLATHCYIKRDIIKFGSV